MTKTRILGLSVVALVVVNIALLVFMVVSKPPHPRHGKPEYRPKREIIKRLALDDTQVKAYEDLIKDHRVVVEEKEKEISVLKNKLYALLKTDDHQQLDSLTQQIGRWQTEIEQFHFHHFVALKALCRPDQQQAFFQLTEDLVEVFKLGKKKKN